MRPIPETVRAIEELGPFVDGGNPLEELVEMGARVSAVVPDCVGLSLVSAEHGVTFTLMASRRQIAFLDALQHTAGADGDERGCAQPADPDDVLDEEAWRQRALPSAAPCVASTLTLPVVSHESLSGGVTLYGASRQAFAGHHEQLAEILGAWAPGAVTNADLSFSTLRDAEQAPVRLRRASTIVQAVQIVAGELAVSVEAARERLREAARRAGISDVQLAEAVISLRRDGC